MMMNRNQTNSTNKRRAHKNNITNPNHNILQSHLKFRDKNIIRIRSPDKSKTKLHQHHYFIKLHNKRYPHIKMQNMSRELNCDRWKNQNNVNSMWTRLLRWIFDEVIITGFHVGGIQKVSMPCMSTTHEIQYMSSNISVTTFNATQYLHSKSNTKFKPTKYSFIFLEIAYIMFFLDFPFINSF